LQSADAFAGVTTALSLNMIQMLIFFDGSPSSVLHFRASSGVPHAFASACAVVVPSNITSAVTMRIPYSLISISFFVSVFELLRLRLLFGTARGVLGPLG